MLDKLLRDCICTYEIKTIQLIYSFMISRPVQLRTRRINRAVTSDQKFYQHRTHNQSCQKMLQRATTPSTLDVTL
jgi:hypothetical protein